jgi:hypothetical protein
MEDVGIFHGHLVYLFYSHLIYFFIFPRFGILNQDKSGNPASQTKQFCYHAIICLRRKKIWKRTGFKILFAFHTSHNNNNNTNCSLQTLRFIYFLYVHACESRCQKITLRKGRCQGDQIGRIFAYWAIVYFGQFFSTAETIPNMYASIIPHCQKYPQIFVIA